ncbi:hypothetical protein M0R88_14760 [Halorussus gelatinilyticus]|uniref:Sialidase n=1 Tax=Halorussus gelatinilyticus TaxID=2937524 RepID=A0A8U0IFV7_9EURY|nr:hypothetical protein [Halorussus gelatinilyticus]UPV99767.1 hypothetical protein M0R88_14760 [Halorussus gelatinilyticus]
MRTTALLVVGLVVASGALPAVAPAEPAHAPAEPAHAPAEPAHAPAEPALAQEEGTVVGRPNIELSATDNRFGPGEQAIFEVFVSNNGDLDRGGPSEFEQRVTTARNVRLDIREDRLPDELAGELQVETGEVFAGSVPEGVSGPFGFNVEISESVEPGTYQIPVEVTYDYTNFVRYGPNRAPEYGDSQRTQTAYFEIVVEDRPQFDVRAQDLTPITAGDTTTYRLEVTNEGTTPATDARVQLSVANTSVYFGGADDPQQQTSVFFERIAPGETKTFTVSVGASGNTAPGTYLADASVAYTNPRGVRERSRPLTFGVLVGGEQTFAVRDVFSTLRVGETGVVRGRLVNTGETNVSNAVVVVGGENTNFRPRETEFAAGNLAPGESANFSFRIDTANATDAGPRRIPVRVQYRNSEGEQRTSDQLDVQVAVAREQTFDVGATATGLVAGDRGTVSGTVLNTGETNVSDAVVVLQTQDAGLRPIEREFAVGDLAPNESANFEFEVAVPNESNPGVRPVSFRIRYRNADNEIRYSESFDAAVSVGGERTFAVRNVSADLQVADSGTISGTVVNTADVPVSNAVVVYGGSSGLVPREQEVAVGRLQPGEAADFEFTVDVPNASDPGSRQATFFVRYRNRNGDLRLSEGLDARVAVGEEQTFGVGNVTGTLRVGETGNVAGQVTNRGQRAVSNAVLVLNTNNPNLDARESEYALGRLGPNESVPFEYTIDVNGEAEPGPRQVSFRVSYRNRDGDLRVSDAIDSRVAVAPERDEFRVEPVNASVPVGGADVVEVRVTNTANQTLRDVEAKLFASDPLSSDNDEAFVSRLQAGESTTMQFRVAAAGGSIPKVYPVSVDFTYEDARGDTVLSDTYRVPIEVTERQRRGLGLPIGGVSPALVGLGVAVVLLGALVWWKHEAIAGLLP